MDLDERSPSPTELFHSFLLLSCSLKIRMPAFLALATKVNGPFIYNRQFLATRS